MARTIIVGEVSEEAQKLVKVAKEAFFEGIKFAKVGFRIGDVCHAIGTHIEKNGFYVVKEFQGHGVRKKSARRACHTELWESRKRGEA